MMTIKNAKFFFKGVNIDDKTGKYIEKRLSVLNKFNKNILKTEIEIDLDKKGKFRVEVIISTSRNMFRADETTDSIETSIDIVTAELQNQMTRLKGRLHTLKKRGAMSLKKKIVIDKEARF
jgi:ribosomal subunit interface protein